MGFSHISATDNSNANFTHVPTFQMVLQPVAKHCYRGALGIVNRAYFGKACTVLRARPKWQTEGAILPRVFCQAAFDIGLHGFDHGIHVGILKEMPRALDLFMGDSDPFLLVQLTNQ